MKWNRAPKVERPVYPKLIPIAWPVEEASTLLTAIQSIDPEAIVISGGQRGDYLRVHNEAAEAAAASDARRFPLAAQIQ